MREKCILIITLSFLLVPKCWLIQKFGWAKSDESSFDRSFVHPRSAGPVFHEEIIIQKLINKSKKKGKTSQKSILMLNWEEFHELKQEMVIQNKYKGGYGEGPFKSEQILYQCVFFYFRTSF